MVIVVCIGRYVYKDNFFLTTVYLEQFLDLGDCRDLGSLIIMKSSCIKIIQLNNMSFNNSFYLQFDMSN